MTPADSTAGSTIGTATATASDLRTVRRGLVSTSDEKLARVIALVEQVGHHPQTHALIEPLRPRLARLRPARRLRFERLLFLPLDPVIVSPAVWRADHPSIPRTVVMPLGQIVRTALGPDLAVIEALTKGRTTRDLAVIDEAGALLWDQAARILALAPRPPRWQQDSGLTDALFKPIAGIVSAVLALHPRLEGLIHEVDSGLMASPEDSLDVILGGIGNGMAEARAVLLSVLLARLPRIDPLLARLEALPVSDPDAIALRKAAGVAIDAVLDGLIAGGGVETRVSDIPTADLRVEVQRLTGFLRALEASPAHGSRRAGVADIRQRLDAGCQARFATEVEDQVLAPLRGLMGPIAAEAQATVEESARHLRMLETEARRIGGGPTYDRLLQQAIATLRAAAGDGNISRGRCVRLMEILAGPDAAMAMLEGTG